MKIGMAVSWRLIGKCLQELERLGRFSVWKTLSFSSHMGGFLKWWVYPTTIGFPTKNDHFGVFWGYHHFRKHPYIVYLFQFLFVGYSFTVLQYDVRYCHCYLVLLLIVPNNPEIRHARHATQLHGTIQHLPESMEAWNHST